MPAFDREFTPPAAVADVVVTHPVSGHSRGLLRGKLDTGADVTVIPQSVVDELRLPARSHLWVRAYDGTFTERPVYYVRFRLEGYDFPSVRCIAAERRNVLVGRNVLNRFIVTLDGRRLHFDLEPA